MIIVSFRPYRANMSTRFPTLFLGRGWAYVLGCTSSERSLRLFECRNILQNRIPFECIRITDVKILFSVLVRRKAVKWVGYTLRKSGPNTYRVPTLDRKGHVPNRSQGQTNPRLSEFQTCTHTHTHTKIQPLLRKAVKPTYNPILLWL